MRETRPLQAENAHPQAENGLRQSAGKGCILHVCTDGRAKSFMCVGWPDWQHDVACAPDLNQQRLPDVHGLLTPGLRKLEEPGSLEEAVSTRPFHGGSRGLNKVLRAGKVVILEHSLI